MDATVYATYPAEGVARLVDLDPDLERRVLPRTEWLASVAFMNVVPSGRRLDQNRPQFCAPFGRGAHQRRVIPFFEQLGYQATGKVKPYRYDTVESESLIYEKKLGD